MLSFADLLDAHNVNCSPTVAARSILDLYFADLFINFVLMDSRDSIIMVGHIVLLSTLSKHVCPLS